MEENSDSDTQPTETLGVEAREELAARREEAQELLHTGPGSGNRSGALAFLALAVIIAAAVHFYMADRGASSYLQRLDGQLLNHAGLSLAALENGSPMTVVPSWPLHLYETLRRDIAVYAAFAALAAWFWGLAARARARRDAFLVHDKLTAEMAELRARLDRLEPGSGGGADHTRNTKG